MRAVVEDGLENHIIQAEIMQNQVLLLITSFCGGALYKSSRSQLFDNWAAHKEPPNQELHTPKMLLRNYSRDI